MSLLVWLPLNGNLNNYGLSPATFSLVNGSNGLSVATTGGKISQACYQRTARETADYITSNINFTLNGDVSMCCWCKVTNYGTNNSANGIITQHGHNTGGLGITMRYIGASDYRMALNTGEFGDSHSNSNRTYMTYYSTTNIYNAWHHLCLTYDKSTKKLKMYIDGKLETIVGYGTELTLGNNITARPFQLFSWSTDHCTSASYRPPCQLNDVRLYDNCLTPKEVSEIAKGLIAHYPLSDRINPNLITTMSAGGRSTLVGKYGLDINFGANQDAYGYFNVSPALVTGKTYTLSFDVANFPEGTNASWGWQLWNDGDYSFNVNRNGHYSYTFTLDTGKLASGASLTQFLFDDGGRTNAAKIVQFRNFKIEEGTADTPFVENGETIPSTLADCSGYGYHLSLTGDCQAAGNSARNNNCLAIPNGKTYYPYCNSAFFPYEKATMNCWFKGTANTAGYSNYHIPFASVSGQFEISLEGTTGKFRQGFYINGARQCITTNSKAVCDGNWHMLTATYDGSTIRRYVDGEEVSGSSTSVSGTLSGGNKLLTIGHYGTDGTYGNQNTWMSDVRLYATALSAADIKAMYQAPISVANDGEIFAYEFDENNYYTNNSFEASGEVKTNALSELKDLTGMKLKILSDGSAWARIHWLDVSVIKTYFANESEVANCNEANRFSKMGSVENFKTSSGVYEFMLTYPRISEGYNRWRQSSSPNASAVTGYTAVTTSWATHNYGLRKAVSANSIYNCDSGSTWYAPIGQLKAWDSSRDIPAANESATTETELWVRIDNVNLNINEEKFFLSDDKYLNSFEVKEV